MSDLDEPRVREIVRDELSSKEIPERLKIIEEQNRFILKTLEQKADKADLKGEINTLREEIKGEINTFREEIKGEINTFREEMNGKYDSLRGEIKGEINTLRGEIITKQDALRDLNKSNFRIIIGILLAILAVLIKNAFFS